MNRFFLLVWLFVLTVPVVLYAQGGSSGPPEGGGVNLPNPLSAQTIPQVLESIVDFLLIVAAPIAVAMAIWAGYQFLASGGNEEKIKTARRTLLYVVIGVAVLIISKGLINIIVNLLGTRGT